MNETAPPPLPPSPLARNPFLLAAIRLDNDSRQTILTKRDGIAGQPSFSSSQTCVKKGTIRSQSLNRRRHSNCAPKFSKNARSFVVTTSLECAHVDHLLMATRQGTRRTRSGGSKPHQTSENRKRLGRFGRTTKCKMYEPHQSFIGVRIDPSGKLMGRSEKCIARHLTWTK